MAACRLVIYGNALAVPLSGEVLTHLADCARDSAPPLAAGWPVNVEPAPGGVVITLSPDLAAPPTASEIEESDDD